MDAMKRCAACAEDIKLEARKCPHCGVSTEPLHRGEGRTLLGVCAALARQFGLDAALVRVAFVVALALSGGTAVLVYLLLWAVTPPSALGRAPLQRVVDWASSVGGSDTPRVETRV